jgi:RNA polymerase sigma factor (sigma-70 family)
MVRLRPGSDPAGGPDRNFFSERGSFAAFYRRNYPRVLRYLMHRTRDGHEALELSAETFALAFESRDGVRAETELEAVGWLFRIAHGRWVEAVRRGSVESSAIERLGFQLPPPSAEELRRVEEIIDAAASGDALDQALQTLSAAERDVVRRHVLEGLSFVEIAEAAAGGETPSAARARHTRALDKLASYRPLRNLAGKGKSDAS